MLLTIGLTTELLPQLLWLFKQRSTNQEQVMLLTSKNNQMMFYSKLSNLGLAPQQHHCTVIQLHKLLIKTFCYILIQIGNDFVVFVSVTNNTCNCILATAPTTTTTAVVVDYTTYVLLLFYLNLTVTKGLLMTFCSSKMKLTML